MNGDDSVQIIWAVGALIMVGSAFAARRLPLGQAFKMALAWLGVFGVAFVLASYRDNFGRVWTHMKAEFSPGGTVEKDGSLRVKMAEDGHFWVDAQINSRPIRLMVDSGASQTSIGTEGASSVGVAVDHTGLVVPVDTANGTVNAYSTKTELLEVGPIKRKGFSILVSDSFGDTNVIGMDFLSSLEGWRVEGRDLILNP